MQPNLPVKILTSVLAVTFALLLPGIIPAVQAANTSSRNFGEMVWGNNQLFNMVVPPARFPSPANGLAQEDFFEMAPQHPSMGFPFSPQSSVCEHLGLASGTTTVGGTSVAGCLHDHTITITNGNLGNSVVWHVFLVVCLGNAASVAIGSNSCVAQTVSGTDFGGNTVTLNIAQSVTVNGATLPLTSDSAVETAASAVIVTIIDTHVVFICPTQPT